MDTFTSVLAGIATFAVLGNLAHNLGITDIRKVVNGGIGLAFVSYPDALAKIEFIPQVSLIKPNFIVKLLNDNNFFFSSSFRPCSSSCFLSWD